MSLDLSFKIEKNNDCGKLKFTDTTCSYDPSNQASCCSGYGVDGNSQKWEVISTDFNWAMPSGVAFTRVDLGFVPGHSAKASFDVTGGTDGVIVVCVGGKEVGKGIFVTDIATMVESIVNDINSKSNQTGWRALYSGVTITVYSIDYGTEYNALALEVYVTDSMTVTVNEATTAGANDSDDEHYISVQNLYGNATVPENMWYFENGIHIVTYITYDNAGDEIARKKLHVLIDCEIINGLNQLVEMLMHSCSCGTAELAERISLLKARYEAIKTMFNNGEFSCVNKEVENLIEDIRNACLDCK